MEPLETTLANLLNRHSAESQSNTPDFILAKFMLDCLAAFNTASVSRERWYGFVNSPGQERPQPITPGM